MSQLFVFLTFLLILIVSSFMPSDYGKNLSSVSKNNVCEKQLGEGVKIISTTDKKYVPCWLADNGY